MLYAIVVIYSSSDIYKYMYIIIYIIYREYLLRESECDMAKYFMSRLIYFQEPEASENKA